MMTGTGTLQFSAPEIFTNGFYSESVDLWSAGTVLYTMLSGFVPFEGEK
jgi:serine/threonine protein kinase